MSGPATDAGAHGGRSGALQVLENLSRKLAATYTEVEFYFLGGAMIYQAFAAQPGTARVTAMFRPAEVVREAAREVAAEEGLPEGWMPRTVRMALAAAEGQGGWLELPNLRAFVPRPDYVLAMKCGAMGLGDDFREAEDVRYVLRSMNLTSADEALTLVTRYFTERQLPPDIRERLVALTPG